MPDSVDQLDRVRKRHNVSDGTFSPRSDIPCRDWRGISQGAHGHLYKKSISFLNSTQRDVLRNARHSGMQIKLICFHHFHHFHRSFSLVSIIQLYFFLAKSQSKRLAELSQYFAFRSLLPLSKGAFRTAGGH